MQCITEQQRYCIGQNVLINQNNFWLFLEKIGRNLNLVEKVGKTCVFYIAEHEPYRKRDSFSILANQIQAFHEGTEL